MRRRISHAKVARALGWTPFYLSHRMTGRTAFDLNDLEALARLLNVPVTAFFATPDQGAGGQLINVHYQTDPWVTCNNGNRARHLHSLSLDERAISQNRTPGTFQRTAA